MMGKMHTAHVYPSGAGYLDPLASGLRRRAFDYTMYLPVQISSPTCRLGLEESR